jgi:hypothetical protein
MKKIMDNRNLPARQAEDVLRENNWGYFINPDQDAMQLRFDAAKNTNTENTFKTLEPSGQNQNVGRKRRYSRGLNFAGYPVLPDSESEDAREYVSSGI